MYQNNQHGAGLDHILSKLSYSLVGTEINYRLFPPIPLLAELNNIFDTCSFDV